jgi:transcription antitermination factor NusG
LDDADDATWAVAQLVPQFQAAERATRHADRAGIVVYYPLVRERIRGRPGECRVRALFPSYFLIRETPIIYAAMRDAPGLRGFVRGASDEPATIGSADVARIRVMEDADGFVRLPKVSAECFAHGARVKVQSGPFCGLEGLYEGMSARGREVILLEVLGASRRTEVAEGTALAAA